ncbi:DinB family protein [Pseudacidovorax intermedius]|uniref:Diguanylate cyclase n=1 Tax=Pseudacidovorax intermedius TaxID=433924 RepID=A0A147HCE8_9BURK|nr:DinB family protein [Pseudacidovorax intermedius]KTT27630.1 diguanylate cyclase [Pseudacidovorax intermedius]
MLAAFHLMARYNGWMNERLYAAAAQLPEAALQQDRGAFFGSIFGTLGHIVAADLIWLHRFARHPALADWGAPMAGLPSPSSLTEGLADTFPALATLRARIDGRIAELPAALAEDDLAVLLEYGNTARVAQAKRFGPLLLHFFNHQTHHRGQATTLLFQAGVDVGVTDLNALIPNEG